MTEGPSFWFGYKIQERTLEKIKYKHQSHARLTWKYLWVDFRKEKPRASSFLCLAFTKDLLCIKLCTRPGPMRNEQGTQALAFKELMDLMVQDGLFFYILSVFSLVGGAAESRGSVLLVKQRARGERKWADESRRLTLINLGIWVQVRQRRTADWNPHFYFKKSKMVWWETPGGKIVQLFCWEKQEHWSRTDSCPHLPPPPHHLFLSLENRNGSEGIYIGSTECLWN